MAEVNLNIDEVKGFVNHIIKNNRLLWIEDDRIHFKFEEITSLKELEWH